MRETDGVFARARYIKAQRGPSDFSFSSRSIRGIIRENW